MQNPPTWQFSRLARQHPSFASPQARPEGAQTTGLSCREAAWTCTAKCLLLIWNKQNTLSLFNAAHGIMPCINQAAAAAAAAAGPWQEAELTSPTGQSG